jgi:hypothetical protein
MDLDDREYHNDTALGSTDIRRVLASPCDYWWCSPHNPLRPDDSPTPSQLFGRAVHKFVLEGEAAFLSEYAACDLPGNTKGGKEERAAIEAAGRAPLRRDDYNRILLSGQMIRANPHLGEAFSGGMSEVSVFWKREDGLRLKCRFDYLKIRAIADLKSIRNTRGIDFVEACCRSVAQWQYPTQAAHYFDGRRAMRALWQEGLVYGDHDAEWIKRAVNSQEYAFVFVFWQAEGSPITHAFSLSPNNPILDTARKKIEAALQRYKEFEAKFGLAEPWVLTEPVVELDINDLPYWR